MATRRRPTPHIAGVTVTTAFLLAAFFHAPPPLTFAQEEPPPWLVCGPEPSSGNYTANSTYQGNINRLSLTLPRNTSTNSLLYAQDTAGSVPDTVYALALCRGDANASACETCVATAFRDAQRECPLVKDVLIFYDLCQLRFSNRNFFLDDDNFVTVYYLVGSQLAAAATDDPAAYDAAVGRLLNATADYAADNSSRRFSTGEVGFGKSNRKKIYAVSQCAPDKTPDFCRRCLGPIINRLLTLFNGTDGGGVFGTWCSFRYELYPLFSGRPLLQLPAFVGTPPPAPAPALPTTRSQGKSRNKIGTVLAIVMPTIAALLATTVICFWRRRRSAAQSFPPYSTSSDDIQGADMLLLDLSTLRAATEDFAESKMLGKGGFGIVYKGVLPDGQEIRLKGCLRVLDKELES